jgi:oxygen-dependent protoporphyrinogen oxidase
VDLRDGVVRVDDRPFDAVVLAVPAPVAARLLGPAAPAGLGKVDTTDVVIATLQIAASSLPVAPDVNGILVQPGTDSVMTACSFGTNKWPQWRSSADVAVVRVSAGRHGDRRAMDLDDERLTDRLVSDLGRAVGRPVEPDGVRVSRWPGAFPFYRVGHLALVGEVEAQLATASPLVALAGSSYRGAGIPACITSGREAARRLLADLTPGS